MPRLSDDKATLDSCWHPKIPSLVAAVELQAASLGDRCGWTWLDMHLRTEETLTFAELRLQACATACAIRCEWGLAEGDRALLLYPPGLAFIAAFYGCQYAAVIAVPY